MRRLIAACLFALPVGVALLALPNIWYADSIEGQVLGQNGAPIEGAAVLATWTMRDRVSGSARWLHASAATSDGMGRYKLPAWGPILSPHFFDGMFQGQPIIWAVHPSYWPARLANTQDYPQAVSVKFLDASASIEIRNFRFSKVESMDSQASSYIQTYARDIWDTARGATFCPWRRENSQFAAAVLALERRASLEASSFRPDHIYAYVGMK